jgi:hypothetical protein
VKTSLNDKSTLTVLGNSLSAEAELSVKFRREQLLETLEHRWDTKTKEFVNYWFALETQIELQAILDQIETIEEGSIKSFFLLTLSSIIITKSGGVSLALDLGHTRPHKAKMVTDKKGTEVVKNLKDVKQSNYNSKVLSSPLDEFRRKLKKNIDAIPDYNKGSMSFLSLVNTQNMPLRDNVVDLIITSPPYASNAIDYMRAHKFSLIWLGYSLNILGDKRKEYIGGESISTETFASLPDKTMNVIHQLARIDNKKARVLHRYYTEMSRTFKEMLRVLKPGKAAIVVVGTSILRGIDTQTGLCLAEIGSNLGFEVSGMGIRDIDRNKRMLPVGKNVNLDSQIQNRMHQEFVIGFYKPHSGKEYI